MSKPKPKVETLVLRSRSPAGGGWAWRTTDRQGSYDYASREKTLRNSQQCFKGSQMDLSRLSQNQQVALGGSTACFVASFLPWFSESFGSWNAWDTPFFGWAGVVLVTMGAIVLGLKALDVRDIAVVQLEAEQISLLTIGLGTILIFVQFAFGLKVANLPLSRTLGIFLALLGAAAATYGTFGTMIDEGIEMPTADNFKPRDDN